MQSRSLDFTKTEVGYNSGQFHHGQRKDEQLIEACIKYGLLKESKSKSRTGGKSYQAFGKWCIAFALRNAQEEITGLYFRSILNDEDKRHYYLKNRSGLYPGYPRSETKKLILTESIIDAATLLEQDEVRSNYEVLALYGTNGLTPEHQLAIRKLQELEEIIFFLMGINQEEWQLESTQSYFAVKTKQWPLALYRCHKVKMRIVSFSIMIGLA